MTDLDPTQRLQQQYRAIREDALRLEGTQITERFRSLIKKAIAHNAQNYGIDRQWQDRTFRAIHAEVERQQAAPADTPESRALLRAIDATGLDRPEALSLTEAPSVYRAKIDPGATVTARKAWNPDAVYSVACNLAKQLDRVSAKNAPLVSTADDGDLLIDFQKRPHARQFPRFTDYITREWVEAHKGRWLFVPGVKPDGKLEVLDRRHNGQQSTLRAGKNGSGKSMQELVDLHVNTLLLTPDELHLYVADPHGELSPYEGLPHLHGRKVETSAIGALRIAVQLEEEMTRRLAILKRHNVNNIDKLSPSSRLPYIQFVLDEFSGIREDLDLSFDEVTEHFPQFYQWDDDGKLQSKTKPSVIFSKRISRLGKEGRKVGIGLDLTEQSPNCEVVPSSVKNELVAQCFRVKTATASRVVLDENGGESLLGQGDSLVLNPDGLVRCQGLYLSDADMQPLRDRCASARPSGTTSEPEAVSVLPDYWEEPESTRESESQPTGELNLLPLIVREYLQNTPSENLGSLTERVCALVKKTSVSKASAKVFGISGGRRFNESKDAIEFLLTLKRRW